MKKIITYSIIAVILAGVGYFIWRDLGASKVPDTAGDEAQIGSEEKDRAATTTVVKTDEGAPVASLNITDFSKIVIDPNITGATKEKLTADIQEIVKTLEGNAMNPAAWTQLGILRQSAKDYDGAIAAWEFANTLSSQNAVPFLNIANLYGYYLHDNTKAESYFKKAIAAEPNSGYSYFRAFEFYTDIKEPAKARAVLERGVAANPADTQLKAVLDFLNKTQ